MYNDTKIIKEALSYFARYESQAMCKAIENVQEPSEAFYVRLRAKANSIKQAAFKAISFKKRMTILVAAIVIAASLFAVACTEEVRTIVGGFFVEWFDGNIELTHTDKKGDDLPSIENIEISYIPDGFEFEKSEGSGQCKKLIWENGESIISLFMAATDNISSLSTENNNYTVITVGKYTVHRIENPNQICALWYDGYAEYYLDRINLPWEEIVPIIEGINYNE